MKLNEIIKSLQATVLKQRNIDEPEIIDLVNRALIRVYRDFNLLNAKQEITCTTATSYDLDADIMVPVYATTLEKYLKDKDGVLINSTGTSLESDWKEIPINDPSNTNSVIWQSYDNVNFLFPTVGQVIRLYSRKNATFLTDAGFDGEVPLPLQYLQSFEYYVGHLAYIGLPDKENKAQSFLQMYALDRKDIRDQGLEHKQVQENSKLDDRDFP